MRLNRLVALLIVTAAMSVYGAEPPAVMVPGLWQITVQTHSPILSAPITHNVCVDKALTARPDPPKAKSKDDCQVFPDPSPSNETAYTIRCATQRNSSSSRFTYLGDHFQGTVTLHNEIGDIQQTYTGVRVGDCEETQPAPTLPPPPQIPTQPAPVTPPAH